GSGFATPGSQATPANGDGAERSADIEHLLAFVPEDALWSEHHGEDHADADEDELPLTEVVVVQDDPAGHGVVGGQLRQDVVDDGDEEPEDHRADDGTL